MNEKNIELVKKYQSVFSGNDGREVLEDILKSSFVLSSTYTSKDAVELAFNEGMRNSALRIMKILEVDLLALDNIISRNREGNIIAKSKGDNR